MTTPTYPSPYTPFSLCKMAFGKEIPKNVKTKSQIALAIISLLSVSIFACLTILTVVGTKLLYKVKILKNGSLLANNILKISLLVLSILFKIFSSVAFSYVGNVLFASILKRKDLI